MKAEKLFNKHHLTDIKASKETGYINKALKKKNFSNKAKSDSRQSVHSHQNNHTNFGCSMQTKTKQIPCHSQLSNTGQSWQNAIVHCSLHLQSITVHNI